MDGSELAFKAGELAGKMAQLQHGDQCESNNIMNSAGCDCGLKEARLIATDLIMEIMERLS